MTEPPVDPLSDFPEGPLSEFPLCDSSIAPLPPARSTFVAPAPRPQPGIWGAIGWCAAMIVVLQLMPGLVGGMSAMQSAARFHPQTDPLLLQYTDEFNRAMLPWIAFAQAATIGSALLVASWMLGPGWATKIGLRVPRPMHLVLALLGLPGMMVVGMFVDEVSRQWLPQLMDLDATFLMFAKWPTIICILVIGFGPGIGEELWFRGYFGQGLVGRYGAVVGVLLTSLLFGIVHLEPSRIVGAAAIGIVLHLTYLATRSLFVPMLLHAVNNSLSMLALRYPESGYAEATSDDIPYSATGAALLLMAIVGRLLYKTRVVVDGETAATAASATNAVPAPQSGFDRPPSTSRFDPLGWSAVFVAAALLVVFIVPAVKSLEAKAALFHVATPTRGEVDYMVRQEPMTAANWPTWSARLRGWLPVRTQNCDPAFNAAREFLRREYELGSGERGVVMDRVEASRRAKPNDFAPPMRDDPIAWYVHGRGMLRQVGDPGDSRRRGQEAEKFLRRSIELDPTIGRAHYALAVALYLQADTSGAARYTEARREAAEGQRLDPATSAKAAEAFASLMKGRYLDAERLYTEVVRERPYDLEMHRAIAQARVMQRTRERGSR